MRTMTYHDLKAILRGGNGSGSRTPCASWGPAPAFVTGESTRPVSGLGARTLNAVVGLAEITTCRNGQEEPDYRQGLVMLGKTKEPRPTCGRGSSLLRTPRGIRTHNPRLKRTLLTVELEGQQTHIIQRDAPKRQTQCMPPPRRTILRPSSRRIPRQASGKQYGAATGTDSADSRAAAPSARNPLRLVESDHQIRHAVAHADHPSTDRAARLSAREISLRRTSW